MRKANRSIATVLSVALATALAGIATTAASAPTAPTGSGSTRGILKPGQDRSGKKVKRSTQPRRVTWADSVKPEQKAEKGRLESKHRAKRRGRSAAERRRSSASSEPVRNTNRDGRNFNSSREKRYGRRDMPALNPPPPLPPRARQGADQKPQRRARTLRSSSSTVLTRARMPE